MNDAMREALSDILFFDDATPIDELARRCAEPLHLSGEAAAALTGEGGPFALWPEPDGCALLAADLHSLARDAGLPDAGLVLRLPATICGTPLVRITADAFRPWLSYGIGLRLLALPEGMRETADRSLSPLCFENLAIPSTLERFGARPVQWSKLTRYPDGVRYLVHPDNPALLAEDGSLYSRDGETLIAQAYPYGECVEVRPGVRCIRQDAFLHTPNPPRRIVCPDSLEEARDDIDPALLWIRSNHGAFARVLKEAGRRAVSPAYKIVDGDVYDFDDEGALLVVTASEKTTAVTPDAVEGVPLVRIGRRALAPRATAAVISSQVKDIEDGNICEGAEKIALGENVRRIGRGCFMHAAEGCVARIPRSVECIGERSFSGGWVRFDALDTAAYIPAGVRGLFNPTAYRDADAAGIELAGKGASDKSCFGVPFDMRAYDELLAGERAFLTKTQALVERLAGKAALQDDAAASFARQLEKNAEAACTLIAERRSRRAIERLADAGFYEDEQRFLFQCEQLRRAHAAEALGCLMQRREAAAPAKPSDRFAF